MVGRWMIVPVLMTLWGQAGVLAGNKSAVRSRTVRRAYGIEKRVPWTSSHIVGTPDPPRPYRTEVVFPKIRFDEPLEVTLVPASHRIAIAERHGKIYTFESKRDAVRKSLLLDVGRTVYGLAFHPNFEKNGYFYVTSIVSGDKPSPTGSRVSRFQAVGPHHLTADKKSERVILEWQSGGHNGGCLRFGPDGYLYLATGDGSGIADGRKTGQNPNDLLASILRIDVDHPSKGRAYGIPADNPFVGHAGARPEVYSYGHRQVWKYSFDRPTGRLWAGDVGQDLWEMIHLVRKGGNYGWSVNEGSHPFRPLRKKGPTPILPPIIEHSHNDFRSITGGYVYHSRRLPELRGAYIYGDYDTGRVWSFRYEHGKVSQHRELADTQIRIVAFGQNRDGEVYLLDFVGGQLHRLVPAPPPSADAPKFPRRLSQTGLFTSTKTLTPAPGVIPYSVNSKLYSDNAVKSRLLALPGDSQIEFDTVTYPLAKPPAPSGWRFPDRTVLVKTFSLEMEPGKPNSVRRLETRILQHHRMPGNEYEYGAQVWLGYTYLWNDEQTDATLIAAGGLDKTYTITDPRAPGGQRKQTWHFPSRAECTLCHTMAAKYVLAVNTLQMNRDHNYGGVIANQLATLNHLGIFRKPLTIPPSRLPRLADYHDTSLSIDVRARAYLHANCAHCHRKWGGGNADFRLPATLTLQQTGLLNVRPQHGAFGLNDPRLVVPGEPDRSMVLYRMTKTGLGRMPHVGSNVVDQNAVKLIRRWISEMRK